jgi:hypothetical protein
MRIKIAFSVCGVAFALGMAQARADGLTPGGTIIGIFSNPIYSGFVTHDPTISSPPPISTIRLRHLCPSLL